MKADVEIRNADSAPGEFMNIPDGIDDEVPFK